ncbi:MAG: RluA family pseudouridine synthase [Alphaproteobacteria bacterium]|nr:RluA family pseudouridine synthase [Alphaproteobacteria bacterium]
MSIEGARLLRLVITPDLAGHRLDKALSTLAALQEPGLSRARLQALLSEGQVTLDNTPLASASHKAKEGDVYTLTLPPPEKAEPEAQEIDLNIVYEDDDVIVIDKPAGMVVHPAPGNRDSTLVNALLAHCGATLSGIGGVARPGIVHRLDKDTSGLMVVAKNDVAHQALTKQFADRSLSRTYNAVVWGVPAPPSGSIEASIGRSVKDRKKMAVTAKGRYALTHYKVIEDLGSAAVVECKLATGRTHQIRVHLAHIKYPVVGDATYGGSRRGKTGVAAQKFPRQALHATALQFIHPRTGKLRKFTSKLPADMRKLIKALEREISQ